MSEAKNAKDALVASLFELSKAAQDAASATVEFYKTIAPADEDNKLAANLKGIQDATSAVFTEVAKNLAVGKNKRKKEKSKDDDKTEDAANGSADVEDPTLVIPDKKKRKKTIKDPNAPKKPLTMYFAYSFYHRDLIRKEREKKALPALPANELNEIVKKQWESISDSEKKEWQDKYQKELSEYKLKKDAYNVLTDSDGLAPAATEVTTPVAVALAAAAPAVAAAAAAAESASPLKKEKKKSKKSSEDGEKKDDKEKKKKKKAEKS